ncbi:MAG: TetR/AcrR family transcriptional regulator [Bdellovibrionota bacterium]
MNAVVPQIGERGEKTLSEILKAAEEIFAAKGFAAARLEDVAERVGIRRASLVYYFRDKRALYDAVLASVFGDLLEKSRAAFEAPGILSDRIEAMTRIFIDYVAVRPSLLRLLLREVADASPSVGGNVLKNVTPFFEMVHKAIIEGSKQVRQQHSFFDVLQFVSITAGATVFLFTTIPALLPASGLATPTSQQVEAHREAMVQLTRLLLSAGGLPTAPLAKK